MIATSIPRIYTALAEWLACMIFISILPKRYSKKKTVMIAIEALLVMSAFFVLTDNVELWLWVPCMVFAFVMMFIFITLSCSITRTETLYYAVTAFVVAEGVASLEWQIYSYYGRLFDEDYMWTSLIYLILLYGVMCAFVWLLYRNKIRQTEGMELSVGDCMSALVIGVIVFALSNLSFTNVTNPFTGTEAQEISNIRTLVDWGGFFVLYAYYLRCVESKIRRDYDMLQMVLEKQHQQYQISKDSIDMINVKYHDLKYLIQYLQNEEDENKRQECLKKLEDEILQYQIQYITGNSVLDTMLTMKAMQCKQNDIAFTAIVDGELLKIMDEIDICSVFGNALDNSIECEKQIKNREKRAIHLKVTKVKKFILIRVENYFEGNLSMRDGEVKTTKKDVKYHGYGIKSIKYTISKYKGAVHIDVDKNWFRITMLIPLSENQSLN